MFGRRILYRVTFSSGPPNHGRFETHISTVDGINIPEMVQSFKKEICKKDDKFLLESIDVVGFSYIGPAMEYIKMPDLSQVPFPPDTEKGEKEDKNE